MKNNAYIIGAIFIGTFAYMVYNSFQLPIFLFGETQEAKGIILEMRITPRRHGASQHMTYAYRHNDLLVIGKRGIKSNRGQKHVGQNFRLTYNPNDLTYFEILEFYKSNNEYEKIHFTGKNEKGYSDLKFTNGVFTKLNYLVGGSINDIIYGEYKRRNDSIFVFELLSGHSKSNILYKFKEFEKEDLTIGLVDLESNTKFY